MFYDRFIELCNLKKIKPTALLKQLGLTYGNLTRWQKGASVSLDTVKVIAEYFGVTIDYFFDDDDNNRVIEYVGDEEQNTYTFKNLYESLKSHPDYVASFMNGDINKYDYYDYKRIADYMHTTVSYILPDTVQQVFLSQEQTANAHPKHSNILAKDLILNILGKPSASKDYKFMQVRISMVILQHILNMGITAQQLKQIRLSEQKILLLSDISVEEGKKKNYNFSDLTRISEAFNISYEYMFTGVNPNEQVK